MPRRPTSGNRLLIEAELPAHALRSLSDLCRLMNVDREKWNRVPALQRVFETQAVVRRAANLEADGESKEDALMGASFHLGIPPDTIRQRLNRWPNFTAPSSSAA